MKKTYRIYALLTLAFIPLVACVKTVVPPEIKSGTITGSFKDKSLTKKKFKKLKNYYLVLYPVGNDGVITLNKDAAVKLRLANFARQKVQLEEWYINTPDNIILYYRPFDLNVRRFVPEEWQKVTPVIQEGARRFELELMPKNSVVISRELDFFKDIEFPDGKPRRFLMLAELNLESVKVRSSMFSIELKPE